MREVVSRTSCSFSLLPLSSSFSSHLKMGALLSSRRTRSGEEREPDPSLPYLVSPGEEDRGEVQFKSIHPEPVSGLSVANSSTLISWSTNTWIYVYDWAQHSILNEFFMPQKAAVKVVYNPSSQWLLAGGRCGQICGWKWPVESSSVILVPPSITLAKHSLSVTGLASSKFHSHLLVSGSRDNSVHIWDVETQRSLRHQEISRNLVTDIKWLGGGEGDSNASSCVVQSSEDKTLRVWDVNTCSVAQQTPPKKHIQGRNLFTILRGPKGSTPIFFSLVSDASANVTCVYVHIYHRSKREAIIPDILCCSSSANGYYLLGGSGGHGQGEGAELTLWDRRAISKGPLQEMAGHKGSVNGCLFLDNDSYNDKLVASCSSDSTVKIWSTSTGGSVLSEYIGGGAGPVSGIASPSPETLAASTFNEGVYVWKLVSDSTMELILRSKY